MPDPLSATHNGPPAGASARPHELTSSGSGGLAPWVVVSEISHITMKLVPATIWLSWASLRGLGAAQALVVRALVASALEASRASTEATAAVFMYVSPSTLQGRRRRSCWPRQLPACDALYAARAGPPGPLRRWNRAPVDAGRRSNGSKPKQCF